MSRLSTTLLHPAPNYSSHTQLLRPKLQKPGHEGLFGCDSPGHMAMRHFRLHFVACPCCSSHKISHAIQNLQSKDRPPGRTTPNATLLPSLDEGTRNEARHTCHMLSLPLNCHDPHATHTFTERLQYAELPSPCGGLSLQWNATTSSKPQLSNLNPGSHARKDNHQ